MANSGKNKGLVLVIEDDSEWMRTLVKACESAGYEVRRASNKDKAISLMRTLTLDAVVADLRLREWETGNVQGLESLESLTEEERPAVVVVTGHPDWDVVRKAFRDFKVIDVIFKGNFDETAFTRTLEHAVRDTRKRRAASG